MTPAEKILWQELRGNKLGVHFRRQQVIAGLVIELDGDVHEEETQKETDTMRDKALNELGLHTVRFRNEEVLMDLSQVVRRIQGIISTPWVKARS